MNTTDDRPRRTEITALVESLARYLDQEVTVVKAVQWDGAFSCFIRGPVPTDNVFRFAWEGSLGMQDIDGTPDVSASLFLYSHGSRARLADHRASYLELVYEGPLDGTGSWRNDGWVEDGFGEFEAYARYGED